MSKDYERLHKLSLEARTLSGISALLDWDQETYMPPEGAGIRSKQIEHMAGLVHKLKTGKPFARALSKLIDLESGELKTADLNLKQTAAVREWRRDYLQAIALPTAFVKKFAKVSSQSVLAWRTAKEDNAFRKFAPFLEKLIDMSRKKAELLGYLKNPYDALLDQYEPYMTTDRISKLFGELRPAIQTLLEKIQKAKQVDDSFLFGNFAQTKQRSFGRSLLNAIGFSEQRGRLDESAHPFSSASHPTDSRITTRVHGHALMSNISAILHECGHSFYEMGLPQDQYGSPLGESVSLGIHESQSRFWETRIGLSKPFWKHFLPELERAFPDQLGGITLDKFYRGINKVECTPIRIEADEVTYNLHIILRFELEEALINGKLRVRDVPQMWNDTMRKYLGIVPEDDTEGCLQDIHWSMGAFGYFPTYALGNVYASQLFTAFEKANPDWKAKLEKGDLSFVHDWLHDAIYQHGKYFKADDLIQHVTGSKPTAESFVRHLNAKYGEIYALAGR